MFTNNELKSLLGLLDIATKAGGLNVANQSLPLAVKIQELLKQSASVDDQPSAE